ncbi:MAG: methyl-accepting chemotaxis protein [Spirochaetota bacterium]
MRLTIKRKMYLGFGLIILLIFIEGSITLILEKKAAQLSRQTVALQNEAIFLKQKLVDHLDWMNNLLETAITGNKFTGELDHTNCSFGKWYYSLKNSPEYQQLDANRKEIIDKIEPYHITLHRSARKINASTNIGTILSIYRSETKASVNELQKLFNSYSDELASLQEVQESEMEQYMTIINVVTISTIVLIIIISLLVSTIIIRSVMHSFDIFRGGFTGVAAGNLTTNVETNTNDECSELGEVFNGFVDRIRNVLKEIIGMSSQLAVSSEELSAAAITFSENAQNQAASAEEITATVEEISAGMDNVAGSAQQQTERLDNLISIRDELSLSVQKMRDRVNDAMGLSENISQKARTGEETLSNMNTSMTKISQSSAEVTNIIKIINDISEQINLLSLNAAIEAARAGESGRGFAVVADEISKLADQTATSIKDIDRLIRANDEEIRSGMTNVKGTVTVISDIIHGVSEISSMMSTINETMQQQVTVNTEANTQVQQVKERADEIRNATDEQKTAVEEIVKSIANINELTQSTASGSEEMTANAEEIAGMADRLKGKVDYFNVE